MELGQKKAKVKYVFRDDSLYDTEGLRAGTQAVNVRFFTNVLGQMDAYGVIKAKDSPHTNIIQSSMICCPLQFKPRQLSLIITGATVRDANHLASHGSLEFNLNNRVKFRTPLSRFFAVTNGALKRSSEIVFTPKNWLQRLLFPSVVLERHEVMDDAVLRYTPQTFNSVPLITANEAFGAKIDLCIPLVPEQDILIRLICLGQMGELYDRELAETQFAAFGVAVEMGDQDLSEADGVLE